MERKKNDGAMYLRRNFKLSKENTGYRSNKGYVPSHQREGFDEKKVIKLPPGK